MTRTNLFYGRFPAAPYFNGLVKSDEHSGDRCIAQTFAVAKETNRMARPISYMEFGYSRLAATL